MNYLKETILNADICFIIILIKKLFNKFIFDREKLTFYNLIKFQLIVQINVHNLSSPRRMTSDDWLKIMSLSKQWARNNWINNKNTKILSFIFYLQLWNYIFFNFVKRKENRQTFKYNNMEGKKKRKNGYKKIINMPSFDFKLAVMIKPWIQIWNNYLNDG